MLQTKLYAYCDRDLDFDDCIKLQPSKKKLGEAIKWVLQGDANINWPNRVQDQFNILQKALGCE